MPATFSQAAHGAGSRLAWSAAVVVAFAACADNEPTAPASERMKASVAPSLAQAAISARTKQLKPIKDRISGSAYAFFFGQKPQRRNFGFHLGLQLNGLGHAAPRDFRDVLVNDRSQQGLGQSEVTIADQRGNHCSGLERCRGLLRL
jgi:hypothetical protein